MVPRRFLLALGFVLFAGTPALAQTVDGVRGSPAADLLTINATRPVQMNVQEHMFIERTIYPNGFRVMFRINTANGQDAPIVAIGYGGLRSDYVFGWTAFSSGAATCELDRDKVRGLSIYSGGTIGAEESIRDLADESSSETTASHTRPTIVSADFRCDGPIEAGDAITIQVKLFILNRYRWAPADFTFVDLPVVVR